MLNIRPEKVKGIYPFIVVVKINGNDIHFKMGKAELPFYINLHVSLFSAALKISFLTQKKHFLDSYLGLSTQVYKLALNQKCHTYCVQLHSPLACLMTSHRSDHLACDQLYY